MNTILKFFSIFTLIVVSTYFGYMEQATEMGLAILAGALGLAFSNLDKFSEFSGAGFSAKMKSQMQAVIDKETEQTPTQSETESAKNELSPEKQALLIALSNPKYTWRTLPSISKDANLSESEVWKVLTQLVEQNYVRLGNNNKTGEIIWTLTSKGRKFSGNNT